MSTLHTYNILPLSHYTIKELIETTPPLKISYFLDFILKPVMMDRKGRP
jgi:hypothetical protein|tara:strand:- start:510 stop:656 length:147 start_codon:yes stop_codon:yes gene_type:complete